MFCYTNVLLNKQSVVHNKKNLNFFFYFVEYQINYSGCLHGKLVLILFIFFRGKLNEAVKCLEKAIPLAKSEKELLHIFSLRDSARAQLGVVERLGLTPQLWFIIILFFKLTSIYPIIYTI